MRGLLGGGGTAQSASLSASAAGAAGAAASISTAAPASLHAAKCPGGGNTIQKPSTLFRQFRTDGDGQLHSVSYLSYSLRWWGDVGSRPERGAHRSSCVELSTLSMSVPHTPLPPSAAPHTLRRSAQTLATSRSSPNAANSRNSNSPRPPRPCAPSPPRGSDHLLLPGAGQPHTPPAPLKLVPRHGPPAVSRRNRRHPRRHHRHPVHDADPGCAPWHCGPAADGGALCRAVCPSTRPA